MPKKFTKRKSQKTAVPKAVKSYVKKVMDNDSETKYLNNAVGNDGGMAQANASGSVFYLSGCLQGLENDDRVGNVIRPQSFDLRLRLRHYSSAPTNGVYEANPVRVILFTWDNTAQNGVAPTTPAVNDILPVLPSFNPDVIMRQYTLLNKGTMNVLYDRTFVPQYHSGPGPFDMVHVKFSKKKLPATIHYNGTGNTVSSSAKNGIYMLIVSLYDPVAGGTNAFVEYCFTNQLAFKDA